MAKVLLATHPFGAVGREPLDSLSGLTLIRNPFGRRLKAGEVSELLSGVDGVIAGTEPYTAETLARADRLCVISRVGVGLDNVDMEYCRNRGIAVTYTAEAPADAVAELTIAQMLNLLRGIPGNFDDVRSGLWERPMGRLMREVVVGIVGVGRIGSRVAAHVRNFDGTAIGYDIVRRDCACEYTDDIDSLLARADIVTLHVPLTPLTRGMMGAKEIAKMKRGSMLINTSRGAVVDHDALVESLASGHLSGVALDVYPEEPYSGPLARMDGVILTAHIGASAVASRHAMELGAARDCARVLRGTPPEEPA